MILGLAPMDWFTDCAFRQITKEIFEKWGEKDKYDFCLRTEFMNADGYMINPPGVIKHLMTTKEQAPVIAQIFSGDEEMLLKWFADIQTKYWTYFTWIELNMGCPSRNVMCNWWGSALLRDRKESLRIIKNIRESISMPFSVKTRTGLDDSDLEEQIKFLVEVSKHVDMITIHGRTVKQWYTTNGNRDFIYELKRKVDKKCKVIGNGGIKSYADIEIFKNNLDGVGIGQAAIGNPRIFTPHLPSREEIKETILKHLDYMIAYEIFFQGGNMEALKNGKVMLMPQPKDIEHIISEINKLSSKFQVLRPIPEFRKHLFQYVKWIPWSKEFKQKLCTISEYEPLVAEIQKFLF